MIELVTNPNPSPTIAHLSLEVLNFSDRVFCMPQSWHGIKWWQMYKSDIENWVVAVKQNVLPPAERSNLCMKLLIFNSHAKLESKLWFVSGKFDCVKLIWFSFLKINIFLEKCEISLRKHSSTVKLSGFKR
jgi:hypothetical protein